MNCNELKRRVAFGQSQMAKTLLAMREHAANCAHCRERLAVAHLLDALVESHAAPWDGADFEPSPFWVAKLKHRIQEMREHRAHSWESAVMGLRGWLTALGGLAMLLLALSFQWQPAQIGARTETGLDDAALHTSADELIGDDADTRSSEKKHSNLYE